MKEPAILDPIVCRMLDLAVQIQQIPAPTFQEQERAMFLQERFQAEGLKDISIDEQSNVYACLPGRGDAKPLLVSAHTDTVFPAETALTVQRSPDRISGPGIGDNSLGVAGLFGLLWQLRSSQQTPKGDLWLVANTREEGLGNLDGMRAVVDRFDQNVLAYIVLEGMALGQVYYSGLGVTRFRISVDTAGGHSWVDHGKPSAVHIIAGLASQLSALPLPYSSRTTLNVGTLQGGTSVNTIASHAELELDLRSTRADSLHLLAGQVQSLVEAAQRPGVSITIELIGKRPFGEISIKHPLIRLSTQTLKSLGLNPNLNIGSTDANVPLSRGLPAVCLGLTRGFGAHTTQEYILTSPIQKGLKQLVNVVDGAFRELDQ